MQAFKVTTPRLEDRANYVDVRDGDPVRLEIPHAAPTSYLTHGLFRYVGKLPPPLTAWLLDNYTCAGDVVLDPMCGGGTTAIEAVSSGRTSHGFDINPISRLVTEAVSTVPPEMALVDFAHTVIHEAAKTPPPAQLARYYSPEAYGVLAEGLRRASTAAESVLVLSIARSASFANTKKINTVVDPTKKPKSAHELLYAAAIKWEAALGQLATTNPAQSTIGAASASSVPMPDESVDFVLLHPPYLTNTAFSEVTQLQLLLMGHDPIKLRNKELAYRGSYFHVPNGLRKYLIGWSHAIGEAARVLRPRGHIAVINGDGRIDGVRIPVGAITEEFAADLGLKARLRAIHILNNQTGMTLSRRMSAHHVLVFGK